MIKKPFKVHEKDTKIKQITQFSFRVSSPELIRDFNQFVRAKYNGHYYGFFGLELEIAIKKHLRDNKVDGYVNQDPDSFYGSSVAHTNLKSVDYFLIDFLNENYSKGQIVSFRDMANVMREKLDLTDPRTHKNHVDKLEATKTLIRVDETLSDKYFYKKAPDMATMKTMNISRNKFYSLLLKHDFQGKNITTKQFESITALKESEAKNALKELETLDLLRFVCPGKWRVKDIKENNYGKVSTVAVSANNNCDNYLSQLCCAKSPKENKGAVKRSYKNSVS